MFIYYLKYIGLFAAKVVKETNGHNKDRIFMLYCNILSEPENIYYGGHIIS